MLHRISPVMIVLAAVLLAWTVDLGSTQQAQAGNLCRTSPDLFYNYYVPPRCCGGVATQLYLCPRPVPPLVGHTYVTYQPLMPHEFLYKHCRKYLRKNPGSGWTFTCIAWQ